MKFIKELIKEFSLFPEGPNKNAEMDFSVDGAEGEINPMDDDSTEFGEDELGLDDEDELGLDDEFADIDSDDLGDEPVKDNCTCDGDESEDIFGDDTGEFDFDGEDFDFEEIGNTPLGGEEEENEDDGEFALDMFKKDEPASEEDEFKFI